MTVVQLRPEVDPDDRLERARHALDLAALVARGWDAERHVFAPRPDDPLFGWASCERSGCGRGARGPAARQLGLCELCLVNYRSRYQGQLSVSEYKRKPVRREVDRALCLVCRTPGHHRPAQDKSLCSACSRLRRSRGVSVAAFVAGDDRYPPGTPRPSLPLCDVVDCCQWVEYGRLGLCGRCYQRWSRGRPSLDGFKRAGVPARGPIFDGRHACFVDLPPLVEAQLLLGIQRVVKLGLRVGADSLERVARRLRDERLDDVAVLSDASVLAPRDSEMFTTLRVGPGSGYRRCDRCRVGVSPRRVALARAVSGDALPEPGDLVRRNFAAVASGVDEGVVPKAVGFDRRVDALPECLLHSGPVEVLRDVAAPR